MTEKKTVGYFEAFHTDKVAAKQKSSKTSIQNLKLGIHTFIKYLSKKLLIFLKQHNFFAKNPKNNPENKIIKIKNCLPVFLKIFKSLNSSCIYPYF